MARGSLIRRAKKSGGMTYDIKYRTANGTQVKRAIGLSRKEAERRPRAPRSLVRKPSATFRT